MDIVSRIFEAIAERLNAPDTFTEAVARQIEQEIRQEYGGDVLYIAQADRAARNRRIHRDHAHGESQELLMRRYRLSRRQLQRILAHPPDDGATTSP